MNVLGKVCVNCTVAAVTLLSVITASTLIWVATI